MTTYGYLLPFQTVIFIDEKMRDCVFPQLSPCTRIHRRSRKLRYLMKIASPPLAWVIDVTQQITEQYPTAPEDCISGICMLDMYTYAKELVCLWVCFFAKSNLNGLTDFNKKKVLWFVSVTEWTQSTKTCLKTKTNFWKFSRMLQVFIN